MSDEILDLEEVLERVQDDKDLLVELFDIFQQDYGEKRPALSAFLTAKELNRFRDTIHSIKGAAGNISAKALAVLCARLERLAEQQQAEDLPALLEELDQQYARLQERLTVLKTELGG